MAFRRIIAVFIFTISLFLPGLPSFTSSLTASKDFQFCSNIAFATELCGTQKPYVINNKRYYPIPSSQGFNQRGVASWYGRPFHGRKTSNGETYNMHQLTAAHKTLPMNTMLLVQNLENGKRTVVRVNDRGPFIRNRIIDLSYLAAKRLGIVEQGTAKVHIVALAEGTIRHQGEAPTLVQTNLSSGEFYVQIGSFRMKNNALRLQKRFQDAGHTAIVNRFHGPANRKPDSKVVTLYRVQVYVGTTLAQAKRAERALLDHGYVGCFTIAR